MTDETFGIMDQTTSVMVSEDETWNPQSGWTGPSAVLYRSFDNSHGLVLMERSHQISQFNLVSGMVIQSRYIPKGTVRLWENNRKLIQRILVFRLIAVQSLQCTLKITIANLGTTKKANIMRPLKDYINSY